MIKSSIEIKRWKARTVENDCRHLIETAENFRCYYEERWLLFWQSIDVNDNDYDVIDVISLWWYEIVKSWIAFKLRKNDYIIDEAADVNCCFDQYRKQKQFASTLIKYNDKLLLLCHSILLQFNFLHIHVFNIW